MGLEWNYGSGREGCNKESPIKPDLVDKPNVIPFRGVCIYWTRNKENTFSYENQTKTKFENKENELTILNILYMNQKTVL